MCNVEITFEGLMLFCFPASMQHCEVGLLTLDNNHEFKVEVDSEENDKCPSDHNELRELSSLYLFVEDSRVDAAGNRVWQGYQEPANDAVVATQKFKSKVIDLNGEDYYGPAARIAPDHYKPSLFISSGEFDVTDDGLSDSKLSFFRVTDNVIQRIQDHKLPEIIEGEEMKRLPQFATRITFRTQLNENQRLVLSRDKDGERVFELPHRQNEYNLQISNSDKVEVLIAEDCEAFRFHSKAVEAPAKGRQRPPLFSILPLTQSQEVAGEREIARTEGACCLTCWASEIRILP